MQKRIDREKYEREYLAYCACFADEAERKYIEDRDEYRTDFQRDCQRIYHCQAFRRMQGKRQVLPIMTNDHIRTRLTHTLEVAQIARSVARTQRLNEDLTEAIALGHDLGHTPFGHVGQDSLNAFAQRYGEHFEHNEQSLRVVEVLENKSADYQGLNLSTEVLNGLDKHRNVYPGQPGLEGQIVNLADEIAYNGHDLEDALMNKIIIPEQIQKLRIWEKVGEDLPENYAPVLLASRVINYFVREINGELERRIGELKPKNSLEIKQMSEPLAGFGAEVQEIFAEMKEFLWDEYYGGKGLEDQAQIQSEIMDLCEYLIKHPNELPEGEGARGVIDYVAGMTDLYFEREYQHLIKKDL